MRWSYCGRCSSYSQYKNLIDENLKLLSGNNELVDGEILPTPLPGQPSTPTKDTKKISDIVLNDIKKDLKRHVNSEIENLKALADNKFPIIKRSIEDLSKKNLYYWQKSLIDNLKEELACLRKQNINKIETIKSLTGKKWSYCSSIFEKWKSK